MHISRLLIENFRIFGERKDRLELPLNPGLTAIVGENDEGKSAIVDALRFVLGTKDHNYSRIEDEDFHRWIKNGGTDETAQVVIRSAETIWIQCRLSNLSTPNQGAFAEYLTYEDDGTISLYVNWIAKRDKTKKTRKWAEVCSGKEKDGPSLHADVRELLKATYLRPLRDAEREMSAGRYSRLSQILHAMGDIKVKTNAADQTLLQVSDDAFKQIETHPALNSTSEKLNDMLEGLSFESDILKGDISVCQHSDDSARLKQLLEKLELDLKEVSSNFTENRGLGSNNLLFMGCEMLLLETADDEVPIMLIEEPEAHLHPQRQLIIIEHLQKQAEIKDVQIIVTTHSPQLASVIKLENLALIKDQKAFPLGADYTVLDGSDYRFLERFLDATKANLFFAKGVLIVEGDAENILLPTIAKLLGKDFTKHGVSVVNVGHTGLGRFARIFLRKKIGDEEVIPINIRTACLTDLDVLPSCAPEILELDPGATNRKWIHEGEYEEGELEEKRQQLANKVSGQNVKSFPSELWTLEFELANNGLFREVWLAAKLAKDDDNQKTIVTSVKEGLSELKIINKAGLNDSQKAVHCYSRFTSSSTVYAEGKSKVSKSIAAQYLSDILIRRFKKDPEKLRASLPSYIIEAIEHVTGGVND
jgi:putative ATP-dependent endonuclease of the OLD family